MGQCKLYTFENICRRACGKYISVCMVISQLLVNFILDHTTKHQHFIVSNFRKTSIYFWNMGNFHHYQYSRLPLTLKKPGLLTPSHSRGGGGFHPPLGSRPRSGENLCNLAHTYTMSRRIVSQNFYTENQSGFQIMQIYVNFMHMFIFLIIFNKIRGF